jgi:hypothetical protein
MAEPRWLRDEMRSIIGTHNINISVDEVFSLIKGKFEAGIDADFIKELVAQYIVIIRREERKEKEPKSAKRSKEVVKKYTKLLKKISRPNKFPNTQIGR